MFAFGRRFCALGLPWAPAPGLTLADKQKVTQLLHACGATINEMNAVRKHLSAFKGGRLAQSFTGKACSIASSFPT